MVWLVITFDVPESRQGGAVPCHVPVRMERKDPAGMSGCSAGGLCPICRQTRSAN
jgi:hypothetical protein